MRRLPALFGLAGMLLLVLAPPSPAQYGGDGTTTSSTTSTTRPEVAKKVGDTAPSEAKPGENVTFTTPTVFAPSTTVDIVLVRALQGASGQTVVDNATVNASGAVATSFTVPGVAPGIYIVYATGTDASGKPIRVVSLLFVPAAPANSGAGNASSAGTPGSGGATGEATGEPTATAAAVPPPPEVAALQQPASVEDALFEEATDNNARIVIQGDRLVVDTATGDSGQDLGTPVAGAAIAACLAAVGTLTIRRRRRPEVLEGGAK